MLDFFAQIRPYLEGAYFAAGIVLAIGVLLARAQLAEFKSDVELRNERAAREKALDASRQYMVDYTLLANAFYKACKSERLVWSDFEPSNFTSESLTVDQFEVGIKRVALDESVPPLNVLEIIAAAFVNGIADDLTGFRIIGKSYCNTVKHHYDVITILRASEDSHPYWYNIVELYKIWSARFEREKLSLDAANLQDRLRAIPEKGISPVGVKAGKGGKGGKGGKPPLVKR